MVIVLNMPYMWAPLESTFFPVETIAPLNIQMSK